jgi:hypothetical protein
MPPVYPGERVTFPVTTATGPVQHTGLVLDVAPVDHGGWRIDVTWPSSSSPDGLGRGRFYTDLLDGTCPVVSTVCNLLFCVADKHTDDLHVDATGYTWHEPNADAKIVAHVYGVGANA